MLAGRPFDIFDDLLARAFACSSCLSHLPLLSGYDEPTTLSYQITLFGPISADVRQFLAKYLWYYLRDTRKSSDGAFVFGVSDFHPVWESMLRETLIRSPLDTRRYWNAALPRPVYFHLNSNRRDPRSRGMQTDIILEDATGYTIVDAKYYEATSAETAPGWTDIAKQMFYEKALIEVLSLEGRLPSRVENVFIFPRNSNSGSLSKVQMEHEDGSAVSDAFSSIECVYVSMQDCLRFYSSRSQGIQLR